MTDQSSVFSSSNPLQETPETEAPTLDAFTNQLASIKNEEGAQKYKTVDEALNASGDEGAIEASTVNT